jgi:hypothetical protein
MSETKCPECGSALFVQIGPGWHCNSCGEDFLNETQSFNGCTKKEFAAEQDLTARIQRVLDGRRR